MTWDTDQGSSSLQTIGGENTGDIWQSEKELHHTPNLFVSATSWCSVIFVFLTFCSVIYFLEIIGDGKQNCETPHQTTTKTTITKSNNKQLLSERDREREMD